MSRLWRTRCGKRAGVAMRLKLALASGCPFHSGSVRYMLDTGCCLQISQRSLDSIEFIQPDLSDVPTWSWWWTSPWIQWRKANHHNLRVIHISSSVQQKLPQLRMVLANAHFLVNKTFICNDFIVSNDLGLFLRDRVMNKNRWLKSFLWISPSWLWIF